MDETKIQTWDTIYKTQDTPWDMEEPDEYLLNLVTHGVIKPCKALDIGCGTGNEVIFLAKQGFNAVGVDISTLAVNIARRKATEENVRCHFYVGDALHLPNLLKERFEFVLDRACFHFVDPRDRKRYISSVKNVMADNAKFLLIASSSDYDVNISGPYKFSKSDLTSIFGRDFRILRMEIATLKPHRLRPKPYFCLMVKA
jgi:ubiquinone/menaquinone biosynthesis C-methylase UbiE